MKNIIISIFISLVIGLMMSTFLFKQYDVKSMENIETCYILQIAVYSDIESMNKNVKINQYVYSEELDGIHVYVALTKNNKELLENYFKNKGYDVYTKEIVVSNKELIDEINRADVMLKEVKDDISILKIIRQVLEKYEETT